MKTPAEFLSKKGLSHTYPIIGSKYDSNLLNLLIEFNEYQGFNELQTRIKELEEKCKSEYKRGIEDGKIIAEHGTTMYQE